MKNISHVRGGYSNTPPGCTSDQKTALIAHKPLRVLIDWVGFTLSTKINLTDGYWTVDRVKHWFGASLNIDQLAWEEGRLKNYQGYKGHLVFENINIFYDGDEERGIHIDISGQGCRFIEKYFNDGEDWTSFLDSINSIGGKFSRIDIAIDDFHGYFKMRDLMVKCLLGELTSKFRTWSPDGKFDMNGGNQGITLDFGTKKSDLSITMYEKNMQLGLNNVVWNRIELHYRRTRAEHLMKVYLNQPWDNFQDIGIMAASHLKDYITFRDRSNDSNKRRWKVSDFWEQLLGSVERQKLGTGELDRNLVKSRHWIDQQVSKTIAKLTLAFGNLDWLANVYEEGFTKITEKDMRQIEEYKRIFKNKKRANAYDVDQMNPISN